MEDLASMVNAIYNDSVYRAEDRGDDCVRIEGISGKESFHAERIASHRPEIDKILQQMAPAYFPGHGDGGSFRDLGIDREGNFWGDFQDCERLCSLAIAAGLGRFPLPRGLWPMLPHGVPYVEFILPT